MAGKVSRRIFLGFIGIHILHHADIEPIYGSKMMEELKNKGYDLSAGTFYPILHKLEGLGFLSSKQENVNGKIRKYYSTTPSGTEVLELAKIQIKELIDELDIR